MRAQPISAVHDRGAYWANIDAGDGDVDGRRAQELEESLQSSQSTGLHADAFPCMPHTASQRSVPAGRTVWHSLRSTCNRGIPQLHSRQPGVSTPCSSSQCAAQVSHLPMSDQRERST